MERLTLEEAINHEKMMAQRKRWNGKFTKVSLGNEEINKRFEADCIKDAEEHEQFAEWLEELKLYKDIGTLKELKGLKENGTFTGLELAKLAIMQKELKKYEDLEEQGLLVRLPCKVGDMVYKLWYYDEKPYKIQQHVIRTLSELCGLAESNKFGKSVFLTQEEAEKKLEELGNDKT